MADCGVFHEVVVDELEDEILHYQRVLPVGLQPVVFEIVQPLGQQPERELHDLHQRGDSELNAGH